MYRFSLFKKKRTPELALKSLDPMAYSRLGDID